MSPIGPCGPASPVAILLLMMSCSHLEALVRDVELVALCGSVSPAYQCIHFVENEEYRGHSLPPPASLPQYSMCSLTQMHTVV